MALFSPFSPWFSRDSSLFDSLDDHPFLNMNSSFFRDANVGRNNRANVSETATEYKVEVEVPGYQKGEISIEFGPDGKSLTIAGRTEKSFEQGPATDEAESNAGKSVTVEEAPEEGETPSQPQSTAVAETNKDKTVGVPAGPKYWISERSVGSFSRTFNFASALNHDNAAAHLENGLLTVVIPKATKADVRKITIA
jgi:HSP20 family protein